MTWGQVTDLVAFFLQLLDLGNLVRREDLSEDPGDPGLPGNRAGGLLVVPGQEDHVQAHPLQGVDRQVSFRLHCVRYAEDCHQNS